MAALTDGVSRPRGSPSYGGLSGAASALSRWIRAPPPLPPRRPRYHPNQVDDPNYLRIYTSLRNREQYSGASTTMTTADKLKITDQLAVLGVDVIEAGFPAYSQQEFDAVLSIAKKIGNKEYTLVGGQSHVPVICALSWCSKAAVASAWEALRHAQLPRINMFVPMDHRKLEMLPHEVVAMVREAVAYARSLGCHDVQFTAEDAGRSDRGFLHHILEEAIKAGATTLNISDTTGNIVPDDFEKLIADIKANIRGIQNFIISTHCCSYPGLAIRNTIAGACAGARQLEVAIRVTDQSVKNTSLEEVVREIEDPRRPLGGLYTGINSQGLHRINKMVDSSSPTNDSNLRKKGILSFIYTLASNLFLGCGALNVYSYSFPASSKALVRYEDTSVKVMTFSNALLWFGSFILVAYALKFKDSELIDHVGFDIFIGVLFLWILFSIAAWCMILHFYLQIPLWDVCSFGVGVFVTILCCTECQQPIVSNWGKNLWRKLRGCFAIICALPACFGQALQFCANMLCPWLTGEMEGDHGAVLSETELGNSKLEHVAT